jgi:hypothetical protein
MRSDWIVTAGLATAAVLTWLLSMAFSLVASPDYTVPVSIALASAAFHFSVVAMAMRRGKSRARFLWLLPAAALGVVTLDNLGRLSISLGGQPFRILI